MNLGGFAIKAANQKITRYFFAGSLTVAADFMYS